MSIERRTKKQEKEIQLSKKNEENKNFFEGDYVVKKNAADMSAARGKILRLYAKKGRNEAKALVLFESGEKEVIPLKVVKRI